MAKKTVLSAERFTICSQGGFATAAVKVVEVAITIIAGLVRADSRDGCANELCKQDSFN